MGQASSFAVEGGGALSTSQASFMAGVECLEETLQQASGSENSCWIMNDEPFGSVHAAARQSGLQVLRMVDSRILSRPGASRTALVEDLKLKRPSVLIGMLKSPATHIGTSHERLMSETLGALCSNHVQVSGTVILIGPMGNRALELPGLRDLVRQDI